MLKIKIKIDILYDTALMLFTWMTLFFPNTYREVRLVFFAFTTFLMLIKGDWKIRGNGIRCLGVYLIGNIIFFIIGLINKTPGAIRCLSTDLLWPIMFLLLAQGIRKETNDFEKLSKWIIYSQLTVCIYDILYIFKSFLGLSFTLPFQEDLVCIFVHHGTYIGYTTEHMSTHVYMLPFIFALLVFEQHLVNKKVLYLLMAMEVMCAILSGRVAFVVTALVGVVFVLVSKMLISRKYYVKTSKLFSLLGLVLVALVGVVALLNYFDISMAGIMEYILEKFDSSSISNITSDDVRSMQQVALLDGWKKSFMFGYGTGSYTPDCIRDEAMPWSYEYSYHAMLYQKGILGLGLFFMFVIWIMVNLWRNARNAKLDYQIAMPYIAGMVAVVVAQYSNPYISRFGNMWMIYYPFAIANNFTSKRKK